jgi:hypothetical protein
MMRRKRVRICLSVGVAAGEAAEPRAQLTVKYAATSSGAFIVAAAVLHAALWSPQPSL